MNTPPKLGPMPAIGFGTWLLRGEECRQAVLSALEIGYRHIDTAQAYDNEEAVGKALSAAGRREGLFVTTKLWRDRLDPEGVSSAVDESLDRLGTDYVDLLLIHWPNPAVPLRETLAAMDAVRRSGRAKAIGLSNFTRCLIGEAKATGVDLFCNQVEFHPFLDQSAVLRASRDAGLFVVAYCPLARGQRGTDPILSDIAARHGKTVAQVMLRWTLEHEGVGLVVKSATRERQAENFAIFDFDLSEPEMAELTALADGTRVVDGPEAPDWD